MKENNCITRVLHCVGHMKKAGAETFIMNIYRNIDRTKVQFDFLCCENKKGDYDREITSLGGNIYYTNNENHKLPGKLKYLSKILRFYDAFQDYAKHTIVHIHGHHAFDILLIVIAAKMAGVKHIVVHSHNAYAESHIKLHKMCRPLLSKMNVQELACSKMAGEWMFANKKFIVVPNGIEVNRFIYDALTRKEYRKRFNLDDAFVIGHIGRFEEQKNHKFLVEVFKEFEKSCPNAILMLIGDGPLKDEIAAYTKKLGIYNKVKFLGIRNDVDKLYNAMDVFCFPSLFEGLGIVAVEAESSDLPCLFSDTLPEDIDITNKVIRRPLSLGKYEWAKALELCKKYVYHDSRKNNLQLVTDKGFDVIDSSQKLFAIYMTMKYTNGQKKRPLVSYDAHGCARK